MPRVRRAVAPIGALAMLLVLAACGDTGTGADTLPTSTLSVKISPKSDSLGVGQLLQLTASVTDRSGAVQPATVAWMSLNTAIASVSATGNVTGLAAGRVGIVATIGSAADTASIVVRAGELVVEPNAVITAVGEQLQFSATTRSGIAAAAAGLAITWSSSDNNIATVDGNGNVTAVGAGDVSISAASGNQTGSAVISVHQRDIGSLRISPTTSSIYPGQTQQLDVAAYDDAGKLMSIPAGTLRWTSSNQNAASVDDNGLVTAKATGSVVVTTKIASKSATASVNVLGVPVATVGVTLGASTLDAGQTTTATATLKDANGNTLTGRTIAWQSSNSALATVNASGLVTAVAKGTVTITAISEGKTGSASLTVAAKTVASVVVTPGSAAATVGQTAQLAATAKDAQGLTMTGKTFTWASSNTAVATVSPSGLVTAVATGTANITATTDGVTGLGSFTSTAVTAASISVTPSTSHVDVGEPLQLTATAYDATGTPLGSRVPTWASSNAAIATVSSDGRVTGVSVGTADIIATVDGKSADAAITVDPAAPVPVATVAVSLSATNVNVGQTAQATAVLRDASGAVLTGRSITWSSAAPQLASVSSSGLVTTIAAGSASIVATSEGQSGSATLVIGSTAPAPVATVTLSVTSNSMLVGQTQTIGVTLKDAQGNLLTGRTIAWSSSSLSVLTVSPSGTVTAVGSGTSTVTATSEGKSGSVTITSSPASVFPVTNVTVAAPTTTLAVGQTTQATFTAKDHNGTVVTGKTATWSSSAPSVATVSSAGIITGVAGGQAVINATVDGIVGSLPVSVLTPGGTLTTVVVTLGNGSLSVGQTTQASASGRDANGALIAIGTPTWTSSNTAIATVSSNGMVSAVANGSASITATVSGKSGAAALAVATTSSGTPAAPAELPRALPAVSFAKATRTVQVTSNLQAALDAAQPGDSLVLSGTFMGNFVLPTRACGAGITIASAAAPPAPGTRVTPATAASFAKIITPNSAAALKTSNPNCGWRLVGVEIGASATAGVVGVSLNYGIFWLGDGGWTGGGETQTSLSMVPQQIVLDRVYIHGTSTTNSTRCLYLNSGNTIIRDSYLADCHANGADSQAILGCNGPGPYLIENNYLEGAGENVMFGGCDPVSSDLIPSDITIRRNHIRKPLTWMGGSWSIKNLFELKNARRVLVEDNVLENSWVASQMGMAIVLKSSTETCSACSWEGTKDVTVRYNMFRNAHRGLNLQAVDASSAGYTASHTERISVYHNLFTGIGTVNGKTPSDGWLMLMVGDLKDVSVSHNTFIGNTPDYGLALMMSAPGAQRFDILDNVMAGQGYYAVSGDLGAVHTAALNWYAGTAWRFTGNVVSEVDQTFWSLNPGGNQYFTSISQLGLRSDGSTSLSTSAGADIPTLLSRTQGVQSP